MSDFETTGGILHELFLRLGPMLERLGSAFTWTNQTGGLAPVDRLTVFEAICRDAAQLRADMSSARAQLENDECSSESLANQVTAIERAAEHFVDALVERAIKAAEELLQTFRKSHGLCNAEMHHRMAAEALHRLLLAHGLLREQFSDTEQKLAAAGLRVAAVIAQNEVPQQFSKALTASDRELDCYGPRLGQVFRFKAPEAPNQEQLSGVAMMAARAWIGALVALAKALLASANYNLISAFRDVQEAKDERAKMLTSLRLEQTKKDCEGAASGLRIAQVSEARKPETVSEWPANPAYQALVMLICRYAGGAARLARVEYERQLNERRQQFESATAKQSNESPRPEATP